MMKRMIMAAAASALAVSLMIGTTLAYLTADQTKTNTFTLGSVEIALSEDSFKESSAVNVVPRQQIDKDPVVSNTGNNSSVAFLEVRIPRMTMTTVAADGTRGETKLSPLYTMHTTDQKGSFGTAQTVNNGWIQLESRNETDEIVYIYGWNEVLAKGGKTAPLFNFVEVANYTEEDHLSAGQDANIDVKAYAIQSDNVIAPGTVSALDADKLADIYEIYLKQQQGKVSAPSGT